MALEFIYQVLIVGLLLLLLAYLVLSEVLDWKGRAEILERDHPAVWKAMNNRPMRLTLLLVAVFLMARILVDLSKGMEPPEVRFPVIPIPSFMQAQPPPQQPRIIYRDRITSGGADNTSELKGQQEERDKRKEAINEIAKLLNQGAAIQARFIADNDSTELQKARVDWITATNSILKRTAGDAYAVSFLNAHGNAFMGCPVDHKADGCGAWQDIEGKRDALVLILTELRQVKQ